MGKSVQKIFFKVKQRKTIIIRFHSCVEYEEQNRGRELFQVINNVFKNQFNFCHLLIIVTLIISNLSLNPVIFNLNLFPIWVFVTVQYCNLKCEMTIVQEILMGGHLCFISTKSSSAENVQWVYKITSLGQLYIINGLNSIFMHTTCMHIIPHVKFTTVVEIQFILVYLVSFKIFYSEVILGLKKCCKEKDSNHSMVVKTRKINSGSFKNNLSVHCCYHFRKRCLIA